MAGFGSVPQHRKTLIAKPRKYCGEHRVSVLQPAALVLPLLRELDCHLLLPGVLRWCAFLAAVTLALCFKSKLGASVTGALCAKPPEVFAAC